MYGKKTWSEFSLESQLIKNLKALNCKRPTVIQEQAVDAATFTGTPATLGFTGRTSEGILVTGVSYDKADAAAAFSVSVTPETDVITKTAKTIEIEVSPVAKA